jgi:putative sigma-54 modulation protein
MELQIEGRHHFKITEAIDTHIQEKLGKLEKYFDGIHRMHVVLEVDEKNKRQMVELVCTVAKRHTLVAKGEAEDMYVAIDQAERKMLAEMKKYKAKLHPIVRGKRNVDALNASVAAEDSSDDEDDE